MLIYGVSLSDKHARWRVDSSSVVDKWRKVFSHQASFAHISLVKESNLLIASALAWLLPLILNVIYFSFVEKNTGFVIIDNTIMLLSVACIAYCHFSVYLETRRHQRQIADQQVTQETRKQLLRDRRAFKVTSLIVAAILLCSLPMIAFRIVIFKFPSLVSLEERYVLFLSITSLNLLNSFINPIIYAVRLRKFRVAFIDNITCGTTTLVEEEENEMRIARPPENEGLRLEEK